MGNSTATATGWTFGGGLNWLVSTGTAYKDNLNIKGGRPDSTQKLYGTAPITSPNGTAKWFVVAGVWVASVSKVPNWIVPIKTSKI